MIEQLNLSDELIKHFAAVKAQMDTALDSPDSTPTQIAAAAKVINDLLGQLIRMQTEVYNIDRIRAMEHALVESIQILPEATKEEFFRIYENQLSMKATI